MRRGSIEANPLLVAERRAFPEGRIRILILVALLVPTLLFVFRYDLATGFAIISGGRSDGAIEIAILEHWHNVIRGLEHPFTTAYFYPYRGTLAYNDGYFFYGVLYSLLRFGGSDPFLASEVVDIVIRAIGFLSFHLLMRRVFRQSFAMSAFGAVLFSVNSSMMLHGGAHAQLLTVAFVPLFAVALHEMVLGLRAGLQRPFLGWGATACLILGVWLMTAYYMAWFTIYFSLFLLVAFLVCAPGDERRAFFAALVRQWKQAGLLILCLLAALLPFLALYLPKAMQTGMWSFKDPAYYALSPLDIIHVGRESWIWGAFDGWINERLRSGFPPFSEHTVGFAPFMLIVFLIGVWLAFGQRVPSSGTTVVIRATAIAVLLSWIFVFRFGSHTPWHLIFNAVPGAKALRAISRYQLFLAVPVTAVAVATLGRLSHRAPGWILYGACAFLLVEQATGYHNVFDQNRREEMARLEALPAPPDRCRVFFVSVPRPTLPGEDPAWNATYSHNTDAMVISEILHIPTIDGFSTFLPPDWNFIYGDHATYMAHVEDYLGRHRVEGACALDLHDLTWDTEPFGKPM